MRCTRILPALRAGAVLPAMLLSLVGLAAWAHAAEPANDLPADGIYPHGRKLAYAGYSGDPARDLANGFTLAGPVYGDQQPYLERCFAANWPVVAHVGPPITFRDGDPAKYKLDADQLRRDVEEQVRQLSAHRQIAWWALRPEELRSWRPDEMQYLAIVSEAIRRTDPLQRPIFHYNPNHRDAAGLTPIAAHVDVVAKGCYTNLVGRKRDRGWIRWSVEQELAALRAAGRPNAIALVMPELCKDPEPAEDGEIRAWVRHDVYLGLASGAKGVLIWSLFRRKEVHRTWQLWYDAYAECGRELNGELGLSQVFLFGEPSSTLTVEPLEPPSSTATVTRGGAAESTTTSQRERDERRIEFPSWTAAELTWAGSRWLFLINSANTPARFHIAGWPPGCHPTDAFTATPIQIPPGSPHEIQLPPYGVAALRW
ncbi:MAG: hypothetical protein ACYC6Y_05945 [Thermoguttaceae bacterium]